MDNVNKVLQIAQNELGYLEKNNENCLDSKTENTGGGNYTKYWRDLYPSYQKQPWCNAFVIWCFVKAFGIEKAKELLCCKSFSYYTPDTAKFFYNKKQWFTTPKVGDIIYFRSDECEKQGRWKGIHHVGIVYKVDNKYVYTIEGNTDASCNNIVIPNGGGVAAKQYTIANNKKIAGYGRPNYECECIIDTPLTCGREGLKIVGTTTLNIRETPISGKVVGTYKQGQYVHCCGKTKATDGSYWFHTDLGYISGKYIEGWLYEVCSGTTCKWWYVKQGYTYDTNAIVKICGKWYSFNKDGWMIESNDICSDGSIKM